jgi:hypothetical protein
MEQQVGSALLGVLGSQVKQVQGITSAVNGILSSYTGVDNKLDGTFNIKRGVLDTQDFAFVNPRARGTAKGQVDLGAWTMNMLIDLFSADSQDAFMSVALTGPVDSPSPKFASNGAAGATGLMGLSQQGAFNPTGLVQGIPGLEKLPGIGGLLGGQQTAPANAIEGQPGAAIPGVGTVPGVGELLGGAQQPQTKQEQPQPGAALPGVDQLLGGTKKKKQEQPAQLEQPAQQQAVPEPGATEPGATPPGEVQPKKKKKKQQQEPGIIIPGLQLPGTGN